MDVMGGGPNNFWNDILFEVSLERQHVRMPYVVPLPLGKPRNVEPLNISEWPLPTSILEINSQTALNAQAHEKPNGDIQTLHLGAHLTFSIKTLALRFPNMEKLETAEGAQAQECTVGDSVHEIGSLPPETNDVFLDWIVRRVPAIGRCDLSGTRITNKGVVALGHWCPWLVSLSLNNTTLGNNWKDAPEVLFPDLLFLHADNSDFNDTAAWVLCVHCPKLQHISLAHTLITDVGIVTLT